VLRQLVSQVENPLGRHGFLNRKPHLKGSIMLWTIAVVLIVLWVLGLVSAYTMGGFIHILLVLAVIFIIVQVIQGRRLS
jgi:low affinity Fe/Cu permease